MLKFKGSGCTGPKAKGVKYIYPPLEPNSALAFHNALLMWCTLMGWWFTLDFSFQFTISSVDSIHFWMNVIYQTTVHLYTWQHIQPCFLSHSPVKISKIWCKYNWIWLLWQICYTECINELQIRIFILKIDSIILLYYIHVETVLVEIYTYGVCRYFKQELTCIALWLTIPVLTKLPSGVWCSTLVMKRTALSMTFSSIKIKFSLKAWANDLITKAVSLKFNNEENQ